MSKLESNMKTNKKNIEGNLDRVESCMAGITNMKSQAAARKIKLQDAKAAVHTAQEQVAARVEPEPLGDLEQVVVGHPRLISLAPGPFLALTTALFLPRPRRGTLAGRLTIALR